VPTTRRCLTALSLALTIACTTFGAVTAEASTPSAKSLAKDLLTTSYASKAGFTEVAEKASSSTKTGVKSCPNGAQAAYEDRATQSGLATEILGCATPKAATALLGTVKSQGAATSLLPPKQLGSAAVERAIGGPVYTIYWKRGAIFELVALETDIPASSSSSTTTTTSPAPPITAAQQKILVAAALSQNKRG
jgi:hypothetical protein